MKKLKGWDNVGNPFAISSREIEGYYDELAWKLEFERRMEEDMRKLFRSASNDLPIRKGEIGKVTREELLERREKQLKG
jgi:hypothetical protein